jgi:hypothetical protein
MCAHQAGPPKNLASTMVVAASKLRVSASYPLPRSFTLRHSSSTSAAAAALRPQTNLLHYIPGDAFDSHMHIIDPDNYPLAPARAYTPPPALLPSALDTLAPLLAQFCIVQPSIYGFDNSCTLAAVKALGKERACAVIEVDPDSVTDEQMRIWDDAGVRGVRYTPIRSFL